VIKTTQARVNAARANCYLHIDLQFASNLHHSIVSKPAVFFQMLAAPAGVRCGHLAVVTRRNSRLAAPPS